MFKSYLNYYYFKRNEKEREMYRTIFSDWQDQKPEGTIHGTKDVDLVMDIMREIYDDNPAMFYVEPGKIRYWLQGDSIRILYTYRYSKAETEQYQRKLEQVIEKFKEDWIHPEMPTYNKVMAVNNFLLSTTTYDPVVKDGGEGVQEDYSVIGALVTKVVVCHGLSLALKLLCDSLQIKCLVIRGEAQRGKHAWNILQIDKKFYHLDMTWNMSDDNNRFWAYRYFLVDDKTIEKDHTWDRARYPVCTWTDLDYYYRNDRLVKEVGELETFFVNQMCRGNHDIIFRYTGAEMPEQAVFKQKAWNAVRRYAEEYHRSRENFSYATWWFREDLGLFRVKFTRGGMGG